MTIGTIAKVFAGIGAAILLLSGACFVWVGESLLGGGSNNTLWIVGVVLIVAGVIAVIAILGNARGKDR